MPTEDSRFTDSFGAAQSIVTTTAQNDTGLFETNLRDERYLPFEGQGAISQWHIALPRSTNSFDPNSVSDVILHVRYTAREGGRNLADAARTALKTFLEKSTSRPLYRLFSLRHEFPSEWNRFLSNGGPIGPLDIKDRFPLLFNRHTIKVGKERAYFLIDTKRNIQPIKANNGVVVQLSGKSGEVDIDTPSQTIDLKPNEKLLDLLIICNYSLKLRDS